MSFDSALAKSYVVDRHGAQVPVRFDQITARNEELCSDSRYGPELASLDCPTITAMVVSRFRPGMTTRELDAETAALCTQLATHHSDYERLAARIFISDLHKRTPAALTAMAADIHRAAAGASRLSPALRAVLALAGEAVDAALVHDRDFRLRFFGYQTMAGSYLIRPAVRDVDSTLLDDQLAERPQHLYMRIALGVFAVPTPAEFRTLGSIEGSARQRDRVMASLPAAFEFYHALSTQRVSNATPTMLNSGTVVPQLSSCFQYGTADDLRQLFKSVKDVALTSKWSGGVSIWLHGVRAEGAVIRSTNGRSSGIKRYVKILNDTQMYVDQGGKRPGAFAVYLGVDHADIHTFLRIARLKGEEANKGLSAPDLKYALWVPDLFMEALEAQIAAEAKPGASEGSENKSRATAGDWHLFSPDEAPGLHLAYGNEYRALYAKYVAEGRYRRVVKAKDVVLEAFETWSQVGTPYVMYKDAINRCSNLANVAPICSGNLCSEVLMPSWSRHDAPEFARFHPGNAAGGETGVCNLAAICLESFLRVPPGTPRGAVELDWAGIAAAARLEVRALNRVIDQTAYPTEDGRRSNVRHRPIGIGIMGLADVLARLKLSYGSPEALSVARGIAAVIYHAAVAESAALARADGPYETFPGSPISAGRLQPDLWVASDKLGAGWEEQVEIDTGGYLTPKHWSELRVAAAAGVRNCYVTAYMPTATTSNIVGQNESFEPFTANIYTRKTLAGEFIVVNRHLMAELGELGLWNDEMRRAVLAAQGSVQGIAAIPFEIRRRYRTARELHQTFILRTAAAMAPFICQSMSMNAFFNAPDLPKILRFLLEGWRMGLKTGMYYCHTRPAAGSQMTSVQKGGEAQKGEAEVDAGSCSRAGGACTV
jgi:ribonucleoside-diphosphate reductase alpha subunit